MPNEIKINKPLYRDNPDTARGPAGAGGGPLGGGLPKAARPPAWMRGAAVVVDALVLYVIATVALKLAHPSFAALGAAGPFAGLAAAFLYLALGNSALTQGSTLGKLLMRLQACDARTSADLSPARAALRAALTLWPLALGAALQHRVQSLTAALEFTAEPILLNVATIAVSAAWYVANAVKAAGDPHGRSFTDALCGSVVASLDAPDVERAEFLREVREGRADIPRRRRAWRLAALATVSIAMFAAFLARQGMTWVANWPDKAEAIATARAMEMPGFGYHVLLRPEGPSEAAVAAAEADGAKAEPPVGIRAQFRRMAPLTKEDVLAMPEATKMLDRVTSVVLAGERRAQARAKADAASSATAGAMAAAAEPRRADPPTATTATAGIPEPPRRRDGTIEGQPERRKPREPGTGKVVVQVGFASYADLFFANEAREVYREERTLDLDAPTTGTAVTAAAPTKPTAGAAVSPTTATAATPTSMATTATATTTTATR